MTSIVATVTYFFENTYSKRSGACLGGWVEDIRRTNFLIKVVVGILDSFETNRINYIRNKKGKIKNKGEIKMIQKEKQEQVNPSFKISGDSSLGFEQELKILDFLSDYDDD